MADEVYGNGALRRWLEAERQAFVLAIRADLQVWVVGRAAPGQVAAATIADALPARARGGREVRAPGTRALVCTQWATVPVERLGPPRMHALLIRQHPTSGDRAYYLVFTPHPAGLATLVRVAGQRWAIEQGVELSKQEGGLDQYEVRTYPAWYRFMTLTPGR